MFAAKNRSNGAPFSICAVSIPEEPNVKLHLMSYLDSNTETIESIANCIFEATAMFNVSFFDAVPHPKKSKTKNKITNFIIGALNKC
jgi:hypothetical protein